MTPYLQALTAPQVEVRLPDGTLESAWIFDGVLQVESPPDVGTAALIVQGYAPVSFAWTTDHGSPRCQDSPIDLTADSAIVFGRVTTGGRPAAGASVALCGRLTFVDGHGDYLQEVEPGECSGYAALMEGEFARLSPSAKVQIEPAAQIQLDFEIPERPVGLGLACRPSPAGMLVTSVGGGSPAERAGIHPGDRITSVDGTPVGDDYQSFVKAAVGPVDSDVVLVITTASGRPDTLILRRAYLPP